MEAAERALLEQLKWRLEVLEAQLSARFKDVVEAKALLKAALTLSDQQAKAEEANHE